eukprot:Nk52_evm13s913 gene=Nk52_evmTU13s913
MAKSINNTNQQPEVESIRVLVRCRPLVGADPDEEDNSAPPSPSSSSNPNNCVTVVEEKNSIILHGAHNKTFSYDHVAGPGSTQEEIFRRVAKPICENAILGYNGTIFAYGQTGSGKTFTMIGNEDRALRGIMPRSFEYIFSLIQREKGRVKFLCKCSYLEIYKDHIYDLLDDESPVLQLRENIKKGVYVESLTEKVILDPREAQDVLEFGNRNRRIGSTSMNRESSRSHAVFTLYIEAEEKKAAAATNLRSSRLHLIDLAGSERQRDTQAEGARLKEASGINNSLSTLGKVIMSLVDREKGRQRHIPYRESKLTFLLKDSLGGNSKTFIIANVTPSTSYFGETLSTLKFVQNAKLIKNNVVINEDYEVNVQAMQAQIVKLKEELRKMCQSPVSSSNSSNDNNGNDNNSLYVPGGEESVLLQAATRAHQDALNRQKRAESLVVQLKELCARKDKTIQSTRMIVRLRDSLIKKLEGANSCSNDERVLLLQEEVEELKRQVEFNPEVTKFAMENEALVARLMEYKEMYPEGASENQKIIQMHDYCSKLEMSLCGEERTEELEEKLECAKKEVKEQKDMLLDAQKEVAAKEKQVEGLAEEILAGREEYNTLQKQTEELLVIRGEYDVLVEEKSFAEQQFTREKKRCVELAAENSAMSEKIFALEQTKQKETELYDEIAQLQDSLKKSEKRSESLGLLSSKVESLQSQLEDSQRAFKESKAAMHVLQGEKDIVQLELKDTLQLVEDFKNAEEEKRVELLNLETQKKEMLEKLEEQKKKDLQNLEDQKKKDLKNLERTKRTELEALEKKLLTLQTQIEKQQQDNIKEMCQKSKNLIQKMILQKEKSEKVDGDIETLRQYLGIAEFFAAEFAEIETMAGELLGVEVSASNANISKVQDTANASVAQTNSKQKSEIIELKNRIAILEKFEWRFHETEKHKQVVVRENQMLKNRIDGLTVSMEGALDDTEAFALQLEEKNKQLALVKQSESQMFEEKESLHSALESAQEELCKLRQENAKLIGHQNARQKIQLHLNIKKENNTLREQNAKLLSKLKEQSAKSGKENVLL